MQRISNQRLYEITTAELENLGFNMRRRGSQTIRTILMIYAKDPHLMEKTQSEVLDYIGEDLGVTGQSLVSSSRDVVVDSFMANHGVYQELNPTWDSNPPMLTEFCRFMGRHIRGLYMEDMT